MTQGGKVGGGSLALRLVTIAVVPMIALGATSFRQIQRDEVAAEATADFAEAVTLQREASSVIAPASLERIALEGLAQIDALGLDRELVTSLTGIDFLSVYESNRTRLDQALDNLNAATTDVVLPSGVPATTALDEFTERIAEQRVLGEQRAADPQAIGAIFDELAVMLEQLLSGQQTQNDNAVVGLDDAAKLQAIARANASAADLTHAVVEGLLYADPGGYNGGLTNATAVHNAQLDTFEALLDPAEQAAFTMIREAQPIAPPELIAQVTDPDDSLSSDATSVGSIAVFILHQLEYLDELDGYASALQLDISEAAAERAEGARADVQQSKLLVLAVTLVTLASTLFVLITTGQPLLRLSKRAALIGDGDLTIDPLPIKGPRVVRRLTKSVNDMLVTLAGVDQQIEMMSTGDLSATANVDLPGAIGVSMRQSVARLSSVTEQLAHQARHDLLTGLPNRFAAMERLDQLRLAGTPFALLFVDIDGFKGVNDSHGHELGDQVLREVARRLSASTRTNEFIARLGGDEFVVILTAYENVDDAMHLGHRLIQEVEQPYGADHGIFALSASVGVVTPEPGISSVEALHQADSALYLAKHRGRGRVERFDATLQADIEREADLALALRHGVRNSELELHFQPIMSLGTGRMDHVEALVRWNRPGTGLVPPNDFIPIAERSSLIFEIERWVLLRSCEVLAHWRALDAACQLRLAVNISGRHLIEGDLIGDLDMALEATGADPTMLEFELTETHLLEDLDVATTLLNTIRSRGIAIAVDDFGTGYSSMNYLRDLPIDTIKIDRSFVARSTEQGYDSTVIEAVLTIARSLGLSVVAEGIETHAQLEFVRRAGCHRAQGYLLARPTPLEDAEAVLLVSRSAAFDRQPVAAGRVIEP